MTQIVDKYFDKNDFSKRVKSVLESVVKETGFKVEREIFRGFIYDQDKLGSVIYKGTYREKSAVLKLQGLKPAVDEIDIISGFNSQNKSSKVRLPKLYTYKHWNSKNRYGYLIAEYISSPHMFKFPYANSEQKKLFSEFYQEYRSNCLRKSFIDQQSSEKSSSEFVVRRVKMWKKIADSKEHLSKRLSNSDQTRLIDKYIQLMKTNLNDVKMVFCHAHLTTNDIYYDGEEFVLLSNLYWTYRPEYYDLVFGVHWAIENVRDLSWTIESYETFVNEWLTHFYAIPIVKEDKDAKRKINFMLLERTMGGILLDSGSRPMDDKFATHLTELQVKNFDKLIERIENP